jgi:SAM-dependent methyltransferase
LRATEIGFMLYWRAKRFIAPQLKDAQEIYEEAVSQYSTGINGWLDLGCGHRLLPEWRIEQERALVTRTPLLVGLDCDLGSLKNHRSMTALVHGDTSRLPFRDEAFDLVTSNMVFEHLQEPLGQMSEVFRILKPGGTLIFHTPNLLSIYTALSQAIPTPLKKRLISVLERRKPEDVFLTYYRINRISRIAGIANCVGFKVKTLRLVATNAQFPMILPIAILELVMMRVLMTRFGRLLRPTIIAILEKPRHYDL